MSPQSAAVPQLPVARPGRPSRSAAAAAASATEPGQADSLNESSPRPRLRVPELRVVEGTANTGSRRGVLTATLAAALLFVLAVVVPLLINTSMASMAYEIRDQRVQLREEQITIDALEKQLMEKSSTEALRKAAEDVGMVPAAPIGVISLEEGTVTGGEPGQ